MGKAAAAPTNEAPAQATDPAEEAAQPITLPTRQANAPHVYTAILDVQHMLSKDGIGKDRRNASQGFNFRGVDDVYNQLASMLPQAGLVILPRVINISRETYDKTDGDKTKLLFYTMLTVEYDLVSIVDGTKHTVCVAGEAMDSGDKATNKAMSAAYKYMCFQAFCIPTEGENDADFTTHDNVQRGGQQQQPRQQQSQTNAPRPAAAKPKTEKEKEYITEMKAAETMDQLKATFALAYRAFKPDPDAQIRLKDAYDGEVADFNLPDEPETAGTGAPGASDEQE